MAGGIEIPSFGFVSEGWLIDGDRTERVGRDGSRLALPKTGDEGGPGGDIKDCRLESGRLLVFLGMFVLTLMLFDGLSFRVREEMAIGVADVGASI